MDIKNFALSYYKNSDEGFHIQRVEKSTAAREPHSHDYFQVYYVIRGVLTHHLEGQTSQLLRGDMFIVPPGAVHYISAEGEAVFYSLSFMESFIAKFREGNPLVRDFLSMLAGRERVRAKISVPKTEILNMEMIMANICREFFEKPFGFRDTVRAYILLIITLFARIYMMESAVPVGAADSTRELVLCAAEYIEKNCTEHITLADITERLAISKSAFCKHFYELVGKTFNEYVNYCRIKEALKYLERGLGASAIYGLLGYADSSTFYRNFVKVMGTTPGEYRKSLKKDKMQ
ncbi:MAG: AraC family transcriptional regulator [Clostridia bacterium]|nr:AraC family transcriptional regulator [Clostridia bacterium]